MVSLGKIDLNLFVVLEAIYSEGGITQASKSLHLSQPAVSHALARLRQLLNDPLFVREGHRMVPTRLTRQLINPVRAALQEMTGALSRLDHFDPQTSRKHFRIGLRHTIEATVFPALAIDICTAAPGVELSASRHDRDDMQSALASGAIDAVIDILVAPSPDIRSQRLYGGGLVVAARKGHPALRRAWNLEAYLGHDHVVASSRTSALGYEDQALQEIGRRRRIRVRCQDQWTASRLVAASDMLFTVPERFADAVSAPLGNRIVPFPLRLPTFHLFLYWHENAEHDPANRWLREKIVALYGAEAA
jgi:DNA-binding transcriptional LysR family regulator